MPSRRCGALVLAALVIVALLVHELLEVNPHRQFYAATLQADGPAGWTNVAPAGQVSSNDTLSEFDAAVEYSSQIFARVSKGLSLVSVSIVGAVGQGLFCRARLTFSKLLRALPRAGSWKARHSHDRRVASSRVFAHVSEPHLGGHLR
jgi:hypothetical protein